MKKLLLATAVIFAASQASAQIFNVTLEGEQATYENNDGVRGAQFGYGTSVSNTSGTYNSETGLLNFNFETIDTIQVVNIGVELTLPLKSDLNANFITSEGENNVTDCQGLGVACGPAMLPAPFTNPYAGDASTMTGGPADIYNPFVSVGDTFEFAATVYNSNAIVDQSFVITTLDAAETSEVPVPAAAWLFGSALVGLAGLRKRK